MADSINGQVNKNGKAEVRRQAVTELYLQGYSTRIIAEKLRTHPKVNEFGEVSHVTVYRDIVTFKKKLAEENKEAIEQKRALTIASLKLVKRKAWEDYENSLGKHWGQRTRYLQVIKECDKQIAELEGSLSPTKVEHIGEVTVIEKVKDYGNTG